MLAVLRDQLQELRIEIDLEGGGIGDVVGLHEGDDLGIAEPGFAIALVAADVEVGVGKDGDHLADELIEKLIGARAGGVEGFVVDAEAVGDLEGAGGAGEFGIGDLPADGVAGHVEFRHDADAARAGVGDHVAHFFLGVELAVRAQFGEFGEALALGAEALIVAEVPVEDVEFDERHAVDVSLHDVDGFEVAGDIDHESAPLEARVCRRW